MSAPTIQLCASCQRRKSRCYFSCDPSPWLFGFREIHRNFALEKEKSLKARGLPTCDFLLMKQHG
ncbi:MAG: hypothetical protein WCF30_03995 [Terracidiphilus sp.]